MRVRRGGEGTLIGGYRRAGSYAVLFFMGLGFLTGVPQGVRAQVTWQDLVFTGGSSVENYRGNLASVTATAVDSTDRASAAVGELGVRGILTLFARPGRSLGLEFDAGLRQSVAGGFEVRDYAPREWVGDVTLRYRHAFGSLGELHLEAGGTGRSVDDRPPMPLFIQPGYGTVDGRVRFNFYPVKKTYFDVQLFGERADYGATELTPQLDLLDRNLVGGEVGASWGSGDRTLRVYGGFQSTDYGNQGTFDPTDPFRRDETVDLGASFTLRAPIYAQVGVEGTLNRSNSARPEYDALSLRAVVSAPLPWGFSASLFAVLTTKDYLTETEFARLVPGEEADNASVAYLELSRPLMVNLDGAVRFGWSRAETDIGGSYFQRYGATFLLRFRPWGR